MPTGSERLVLATCGGLAGHGYDFVLAPEIASKSGMSLQAVQDCLRGLDRDGFVDLVPLDNGDLKASVTPKGRQELAKDAVEFGRPSPKTSNDQVLMPSGQGGALGLVLQACRDIPGEPDGFILAATIAQQTGLRLPEVQGCIEILDDQGYVRSVRLLDGIKVQITAEGRLFLSQRKRLPVEIREPLALFTEWIPKLLKPKDRSAVGSSAKLHPNHFKSPIEVFLAYSQKDEAYREDLEESLALLKRQEYILSWNDREIMAGQQWADQISEHLETARIILLMVSSSFLASDYCYGKEMKRALERHEAREAVVIPIIVRPCDWHGAPFAKIQALPKGARAITSWANKDEAWTDVAKGIRQAVEKLIV